MRAFLAWLFPWPFRGETLREYALRRCREEG